MKVIVGATYRHKDYPAVTVRVTEVKPNGAVWGVTISGGFLFGTTGDIFHEMYERT